MQKQVPIVFGNTIVVLQVRGERLGGAMKAALAAAGRRLEPGWTYPVATGNFAVEHSEKTFGEPGLQFTDTDQSVRDVLMRRIEARGFE